MMNLKMKKTLDFSPEEFQNRLSRARELMERDKLDFLLLSQAENIIYLTGYRTILYQSKFRPFLAVISKEGNPVLILPVLEKGDGEKTSYFEDIRTWGNIPNVAGPDPLSVLKDVLVEKKLSVGKGGVELGMGQRLGMTYRQFEDLRKLVPKVQFEDCSTVMWSLRMIKSKPEIAYIKESCRITDVSYATALEASREGISEVEIARILGRTMMDEGADAPGFLVVASGVERYDMINPYSSPRKLEKGDMVNLDIGAIYKGYWSDMTRGFFVGKPTERQKAFYQAAKEINQAAIERVRPGIEVSEIDKAAEETITKLGYRPYMLHRTGHSLGLEIHELPSISPDDHTILETGMVLTIEPGIYDFSIGAFRIEDTLVVSEIGYEYLTISPRDIVIR
jgi:Xaa-Pro aminopeptidase